MKIQNILSFLLLVIAVSLSSCGSDGIEPVVNPNPDNQNPNNPDNMMEDLEDAPDFNIKTWDAQDLKFSTYEDKVLVIWFFGSDCPPCKGIAPEVEDKLNQEMKGKDDYAIVGIDQWDRNNAVVEGFKTTTGVTFPLGAQGGSVASAYGTTYDRLVVVNKEGKIQYKATQRANATLDDVVTLVKQLVD